MEIYYSYIKGKHNFKLYFTHIVEIPTNKGANYYKLKLSKIGNINHQLIQLSIMVLNLKRFRMHHLALLLSNFLCGSKHRIKLRQKAPFTVIIFKLFRGRQACITFHSCSNWSFKYRFK